MIDKGQGLFECETKASLIVYIPDISNVVNTNHVLRIIFRPISNRVKMESHWVELHKLESKDDIRCRSHVKSMRGRVFLTLAVVRAAWSWNY